MEILFVSDYVCPYCLVAKEAMRQALEELQLQPEITWHPFELTVEPKPQVDTWHDEDRKARYQILVEPCKKLGLDMKLPPHIVPRPYTRLAFEGYFYAKEHGCGEAYNDFMYWAYFILEKDIGDIEVLCQLAEEIGLDARDYRKALETGVYREAQQEANRHAREDLQVTHVPTIYINGKKILVRAYTKEEFLEIFQSKTILEATPEEESEAAGCGPDGCRLH